MFIFRDTALNVYEEMFGEKYAGEVMHFATDKGDHEIMVFCDAFVRSHSISKFHRQMDTAWPYADGTDFGIYSRRKFIRAAPFSCGFEQDVKQTHMHGDNLELAGVWSAANDHEKVDEWPYPELGYWRVGQQLQTPEREWKRMCRYVELLEKTNVGTKHLSNMQPTVEEVRHEEATAGQAITRKWKPPMILANDELPWDVDWASMNEMEAIKKFSEFAGIIRTGGTPRVKLKYYGPDGIAFDTKTKGDTRSATNNIRYTNEKGKLMSVFEAWEMSQGYCNEYQCEVFAPDSGDGTSCDDRQWNNWHGFDVTKEMAQAARDEAGENWKEHIRPLLDHVRNVVYAGNDEYANFFWKWAAHIRQNPGTKSDIMVTQYGQEGTGKSALQNILMEVYAPYSAMLSTEHELFGRFQNNLSNKVRE